MSERKIIATQFATVGPHNWQAVREDFDLGDPIGIGASAEEAIADLRMEEELHAAG